MPRGKKRSSTSEFEGMSTEVLRLRLQARNLALQGTREQMIARLEGVAPAKRTKAKRGNSKKRSSKRKTRNNATEVGNSSDGTDSEPEEPPGTSSSFTSEQLAVIQDTVQASLAAWQPPSPWSSVPFGNGENFAYSTPRPPTLSPAHRGTTTPIGLDRPLDESLHSTSRRTALQETAVNTVEMPGPVGYQQCASTTTSPLAIRGPRVYTTMPAS
jgi:hypothetical protein